MIIKCDIDDTVLRTTLNFMDRVSVTGRMEAVNLVRIASVFESILTTADQATQAKMQENLKQVPQALPEK
jgi:hypothetical protein